MPADLRNVLDPRYPDYVYAKDPLVPIYKSKTGRSKAATVLLGEWLKIDTAGGVLPDNTDSRVPVKFRGGRGFAPMDRLTRTRQLEMYFIDVDQGDSVLIQTPDDRRILVDGGEGDEALEFIENKYRLDKPDHFIDFDAVVATHSDSDHVGGLIGVLEHPRIAVKRLYHNGLFRRTESSVDPGPRVGSPRRVSGIVDRPDENETPGLRALMKRFARAIDKAEANLPVVVEKMRQATGRQVRIDLPDEGFICRRLEQADQYLPPFDASHKHLAIEVLWPHAETVEGVMSYPWYRSASHTVNGNSIVLRVVHGANRVLLTGDLNEPSMEDLLHNLTATIDRPKQLAAEVYKAAHHGSQHFLLDFLRIVAPNAAVISSGDARLDAHGHPRAVLLGTITRYSKHPMPAVFSTELAACYRKLSASEMRDFRESTGRLYERALKGIVHLRSDGKTLCLATVHGRKVAKGKTQHDQTVWKWDHWTQA